MNNAIKAAREDGKAVVVERLALGGLVAMANRNGDTPLVSAAVSGHEAVVAQLLDRLSVRDLDVTDPPIEELIGGLFRQGRV